MDLDVTRRIPRHEWTTALVVQAYRDVLCYRAVLRTLRRIGAIRPRPMVRPMQVDPEVLRFHLPTIFHRCVELVLERRLSHLR